MPVSKKIIFLFLAGLFSFELYAQTDNIPYNLEDDFLSGEKYRILQYRANIRLLPNRDSDVIAILSLHDEIEILENTWIREQINNVWAYWYKIKYGKLIGYTFGGNMAKEAFVTDIAGNGITDYFYVRHRDMAWNGSYLDGFIYVNTDLHIYINNQRINTNKFYRYYWDRSKSRLIKADDQTFPADTCSFEKKDGYVLIYISYVVGGRDPDVLTSIYKIDGNGRIEFQEWTNGESYSHIWTRVFKDDLSVEWGRWDDELEPLPKWQKWLKDNEGNIEWKKIDGVRWWNLRKGK